MTQQEYLELLLGEVGFVSRTQRNDYLSRILHREVKYLDELSTSERSALINTLKAKKQAQRYGGPVFAGEPETKDPYKEDDDE